MKTGLEAFLKTWQADCLATHEAVAADEVAATARAVPEADASADEATISFGESAVELERGWPVTWDWFRAWPPAGPA